MRTLMLALGATLLAGAPALIALGSVLLPAPMRWALTITRRLQRVLRIAFALAVAAICPLDATALFVVPLTLNPQQWQEEFGLGVLGMWGMGVVFTYGGWFIVKRLMRERKKWPERERMRARRRLVAPRDEIRERRSRPAVTRDVATTPTPAVASVERAGRRAVGEAHSADLGRTARGLKEPRVSALCALPETRKQPASEESWGADFGGRAPTS